MAEVVTFHHALGLTDPLRRFASALCAAGNTVHTPDLFDGRTFTQIEDGLAYSEEIGGPMAVVERARTAVWRCTTTRSGSSNSAEIRRA